MLAGTKPLSAFLFRVDEDEDIYLGGQPFDRYVAEGRLLRHETHYMLGGAELISLLFALPDQAWRFQSYDLMMRLMQSDGWNDTLERMQGMLLGYEDWQIDWHLANPSHYLQHRN